MNFFPKQLKKDDKKASFIIFIFSAIVFAAVIILDKKEWSVQLGFDPHIFALLSACVNAIVACLLVKALIEIKNKKTDAHRKTMLSAMWLSVLFLVFYILHHLFTGETKYGDLDHNGVLSLEEKNLAGNLRYFYYVIISSHITLAGLVMPFVLFSAYRALTGNIEKHKKLVRYTYPIWLFVAISGVMVYLMIRSYY